MKRLPILAILLLTLAASTAGQAQEACPCVPVSHIWIAEPCSGFGCALSAVVQANGDPYTLMMPSSSAPDGRWIIIRRVAAGAYIPPANAPYACDSFDGAATAVAHYSSLSSERAPMLLSTPDGKIVVVSLTDAGMASASGSRRRSVGP